MVRRSTPRSGIPCCERRVRRHPRCGVVGDRALSRDPKFDPPASVISEGQMAAVLRRIRADSGDEEAWSILYDHYRGQVLGTLAVRGVADPEVREELCAQTLFRFIRYSPWRGLWSTLPDPAVIG